MRFWLVKDDAPSVSFVRGQEVITVHMKRKLGMVKGDRLLVLSAVNEKYQFDETAKIESVFFENLEDDGVISIIGLSETKKLDDLLLDDMLYSLTFVWNTQLPARHFRRGVRLVPEADFNAIVNGSVFLSRSAYFTILGALPEMTRAEFEATEIVGEAQFLETGGINAEHLRARRRYESKLRRLQKYIDEQIISVGIELEKLQRIADELKGDGSLQSVRHSFFDQDSTQRWDYQIEAFSGLMNNLEGVRVLDRLQEISEKGAVSEVLKYLENDDDARGSEESFEKMFDEVR